MQISFTFTKRDNSPERLVTEAEIVFGAETGLLGGLRLVGISLWSGSDDEIYVTMPSRAFGVGSERRYFDFLRGDTDAMKRLKAEIVSAYRESQAA